jgi:hypothetical protein
LKTSEEDWDQVRVRVRVKVRVRVRVRVNIFARLPEIMSLSSNLLSLIQISWSYWITSHRRAG